MTLDEHQAVQAQLAAAQALVTAMEARIAETQALAVQLEGVRGEAAALAAQLEGVRGELQAKVRACGVWGQCGRACGGGE